MKTWLLQLMGDEALMLAYRDGESRAFEVQYHRYKQRLHLYLYRNCRNATIGEELAQDTWIAVIYGARSYTDCGKFTTWLYRIAHIGQTAPQKIR